MATLEDTVRAVVEDFIHQDKLFTALDVSNKVKETLPHEKHRSIRDVVRAIYANEIEPKGWARTPVPVVLEDGSTQEALLYHPLSAAWDLDKCYDAQQRQQTSLNPVQVATTAVASNAVSSHTPSAPATATVTVSATTTVPMPTARDLWKQLFATQPSMFPTK